MGVRDVILGLLGGVSRAAIAETRRKIFAMGYSAGKVNRTDPEFNPRGLGPNAQAESGGSLDLVWRRSRQLHEDDEMIDGACCTFRDNVVGTGLDDVEADTGYDEVDSQLNAVWEEDIDNVDGRGMCLAESQELFATERFTVGECGVRQAFARARGSFRGGPVIELIEAERIPLTMNGVWNGNQVRQGVEYDADGVIVAYHVLVQNPRDIGSFGAFGGGVGAWAFAFATYPGAPGTQRIPAEEMEIAHRKRRVNQLRGVPKTLSSMRSVRMRDSLTESMLLAQQLAANLAVFFETDDPDVWAKAGTAAAVDGLGQPLQRLEPGQIGFVKKGEPPKVVAPNIVPANFEQTLASMDRRTSRGLGIPYSAYSGDISRSSFASERVARSDSEKGWRPEQKWVWEHHTKEWRRRRIDFAILTGRVKLTAEQRAKFEQYPMQLYRCQVGMPGGAYINPYQEAAAAGEDLLNGLTSVPEQCHDRGKSAWKSLRMQIRYEAMDAKLRKEAGLPPRPAGGGAAVAGGEGGDQGGGDQQGGDSGQGGGGQNRARAHRAARMARAAAMGSGDQ